MASIPTTAEFDIDFVISDKTAAGMCRLLTDYLNAHLDMEIERMLLEGRYLDGTRFVKREVRLVKKEQ